MEGVDVVVQRGTKPISGRRLRRRCGMAYRSGRLSRGMTNYLVARWPSFSNTAEIVDGTADDALLSRFPRQTVTRRTAHFYRELKSTWQSHVGASKTISPEKILKLLNVLELFPSMTDVLDMVECVQERPGRTKPINFEQFYAIANAWKQWHEPTTVSQLKKHLEKDGDELPRRTQKMSSDFQVFLGGSCNPTTWRDDIAIPKLDKHGISFYNPQVRCWTPDLLDLEYKAKREASVLFFVLDNQTRSIAALIEVAEHAVRNQTLVLVVQSYTHRRQSICGEQISQREYEDLREGQKVVERLVKKQGVAVFNDINVALDWTVSHLKRGSLMNDEDEQCRVTLGRPNKREDLSRTSHKSGLVSSKKNKAKFDVFLGGTVKDTDWREKTAIPILQKHKVSWTDPSDDLIPETIDQSSVQLFVITDTCRSIAPMAVAAHYVGCRKNMVLCIQKLSEDASIGGEKLTSLAIKDYNRGRRYLLDMAQRAGIKVYTNVDDAVECAAQMAKELKR